MQLFVLSGLIAFGGLFGYGSYREAYEACEKWSNHGGEIEYLRTQTKWEILGTPKAKRMIKKELEILNIKLSEAQRLYEIEQSKEEPCQPSFYLFCGGRANRYHVNKIESQISEVQDKVAKQLIEASITEGRGIETSTPSRKCEIDSMSTRKQILGLEIRKKVNSSRIYKSHPFDSSDWSVVKHFRY